jgi:hypothetical protein
MTDAPPRKLDLPCAWTPAELEKDTSWIRVLSDGEVAELEAALRYSKEKGLAEQDVTKEDFPLPTLGPALDKVIDALEFGRGIVLLRGVPVERYRYEDIRRMYWGLGTHMGSFESQNIKGELMQEITDLGFDYGTDQHRGSMTSARLRAHNDPMDVVSLLCVRPAKQGGESTVRSSITIYNEVAANHPEYLPALLRGFHYDLDGKSPTGDPLQVTRVIPVFSWFEGQMSCRYNQKAIEGGARKVGRVLPALEQEAVNYIYELCTRPDIELSMDFRPGDIQLLNNHVTFHSREGFTDFSEPERRRLLLRLWINHAKGRPLDEAFANRVMMGPRKGVKNRAPTYIPPENLAKAG